MSRFVARSVGELGAVLMLLSLAGCTGADCWSWGYAFEALVGQMNYLGRAVPIEEALDDPDLTQHQKDKLELVIKARDYAEQVIGLNVGSSFRTFVNLRGEALAWNLSASRRDAIEAYTWQIPVAGTLPYLGFFKHEDAVAERERLMTAGYDTFIYEIDAFSTLGLLPDPVASSLLERPVTSLVDTVIHESLHNTVWSGRDIVFNESLATYVGRAGALEFLAFEFGEDSPLLQEAEDDYADIDRLDAFLKQVSADARALYAQDISSDEKIARREEIFEAARQRFTSEVQPTLNRPDRYSAYATLNYNNAFLLVNVRYNSDLHIFADVHESTGPSWPDSLQVFHQAAADAQPYAFLEAYLQSLTAGANAVMDVERDSRRSRMGEPAPAPRVRPTLCGGPAG